MPDTGSVTQKSVANKGAKTLRKDGTQEGEVKADRGSHTAVRPIRDGIHEPRMQNHRARQFKHKRGHNRKERNEILKKKKKRMEKWSEGNYTGKEMQTDGMELCRETKENQQRAHNQSSRKMRSGAQRWASRGKGYNLRG